MIVFECPKCQKKLQAADQHAGKSIRCPGCQTVAKVPVAQEEIATAVSEAPSAPPPPPPLPATAVATPEDAKKARRDEDDDVPKARRKRDDDDDEDDDDRPRKRRRDRETPPAKKGMGAMMILLIVFGVGICCVGPILVALLVPAVQKVREAAARTQSINNLKQITIAFHNFNDVHGRMPFNGTQAANPNDVESGSWAYQILPFVEQQPVFMQVNRNAGIPTFLCPGRMRPPLEAGGGAWTDYFFNNYLNNPDSASQPNAPNTKRQLMRITDGTSNTVLVGHGNINVNQYMLATNVTGSSNIFDGGKLGTMRAGNNGRMNPVGWSLQRDSAANPNVGSWGGPFPVALIGMADGSIRNVPYTTANFGVYLTPDGGEVAPFLD